MIIQPIKPTIEIMKFEDEKKKRILRCFRECMQRQYNTKVKEISVGTSHGQLAVHGQTAPCKRPTGRAVPCEKIRITIFSRPHGHTAK